MSRLPLSIFLLFAGLIPPLFGNFPGGGPETGGANVRLTDNGTTVTLVNGQVTAVIGKSTAEVTSLLYNGVQCVRPGGNIYYSLTGTGGFRTPSGCSYSVITETADMVDIAMLDVGSASRPFSLDVHYILRRGDTGLYSYIAVNHPAAYPTGNIADFRLSWKLPDDTFENLFVDDLRSRQMPTAADFSAATSTSILEVVHLNSGVLAGQDDGKYCYSTEYYANPAFGHASNSNKTGAWVVVGGTDYFNDGPFKQDLAPADRFTHLHFGRNHYNGSTISVDAGEDWGKLFGPFLLYFNKNAGGADACWADARAQAEAEKAAWPYDWLTTDPEYPTLAGRATVNGTLQLTDSLKPALDAEGAWVGLAQPEPGGNFQFEAKGYQHWVKAGPGGSFSLTGVRPGTYTLYCVAEGETGEYQHSASVTVTAGQTLDLGTIDWTISRTGGWLAWEIGLPDRDSKEFAHGDDYWQPFIWEEFPNDFTDPLTYDVSSSTAAADWNYCQPEYNDGVNPASTWPFDVNFNLPAVPASGTARLHLAFAGANYARMHVTVNGTALSNLDGGGNPFFYPDYNSGNALIRQSSHAKYAYKAVSVPVSLLHPGSNTIRITQGKIDIDSAHVMYDYVGLEMPNLSGGNPPDGDGDGQPDSWELAHFKTLSFNSGEDPDGDGFANAAEAAAGTDPNDAAFTPDDTDGDGLDDAWEIARFGGLSQDGSGDPDHDGFDNETEESAGTDPNDGSSTPYDADGDGLADAWEIEYFGDLGEDGDGDPDGDGFNNEVEETAGGDPNSATDDSDGDELIDVWEGVHFSGGSHGPVGVANTASPVTQNNSSATVGADGVLFTSATFDMAGGNAVALLITTEGAGNSATRSVTFAGQPMNEVYMEDSGAGAQTAAIYYLVNPTTPVGQFVFTVDPSYGGTVDYAYSGISLSGVAAFADSDTNRSTSNSNTVPLSVGYTTTTDGGYVLGAAVNNDFDNTRQLSISSGNPDLNLLGHTLVDTSGHFHTHGAVESAGSYVDGYLGQYQRTAIATVAFDGLPGALTAQTGTGDPDADGFDNATEQAAGSDPNDPASVPGDIDADELDDTWETTYFGNLGQSGTDDPDGDGFDNETEETAGSDPSNGASTPSDVDGDGLDDTWEITHFGDLGETGSDDPDGDGFDNEAEEAAGTDPSNGAITPDDTDGDGLLDSWEIANFGDLGRSGSDDADGDGYDNEAEETAGTDPNNGAVTPDDTDGDGLADAWEVAHFSSLPHDPIAAANTAPPVTQNNTGPTVGSNRILFTSASFDMNGGNAVALLVTAEGAGDSTLRKATFAGQPMAEVHVKDSGAGAQTAAIYYLVDPAVTAGPFVFTLDPNYSGTVDYAYSIISLSGVDAFAEADTAASTSDASTVPLNVGYTTTADGGYVLGAAVNNAYPAANRQLSISSGNPDTNLLGHTLVDTSGHFHTHGDIATAGSHVDGYLGQFQRTAIATVAFDAPQGFLDPLAQDGAGDLDGDGFDNESEETADTDPNDAGSFPSVADSDADGLVDSWEIDHFGDLSHDADGDADGDGTPEWLEEALGADPNDPNGRFRASLVETSPGSFSIEWPNAEGVTFTVQSSTTLGLPWNSEATIPGSTLPTTLSHPISTDIDARFYRVDASRP